MLDISKMIMERMLISLICTGIKVLVRYLFNHTQLKPFVTTTYNSLLCTISIIRLKLVEVLQHILSD